MDPKEETIRVLKEIRAVITSSGSSQRKVETRAGFSKGYLSQLLAQNLDLKYWHVIAILRALDHSPDHFFARLYPERRPSALEHFRTRSQPLSQELDAELSRLYGSGIRSLRSLRERLESCEKAIADLETSGVLRRTGGSQGS